MPSLTGKWDRLKGGGGDGARIGPGIVAAEIVFLHDLQPIGFLPLFEP
jgi:hypothetical protein